MTPVSDIVKLNPWQKTRQVLSIKIYDQILKKGHDELFSLYFNNLISITVNQFGFTFSLITTNPHSTINSVQQELKSLIASEFKR